MGRNLVQKLIKSHLAEGALAAGGQIAIRVDQTLLQDALGTMACLQYEAMGLEKLKTELSVLYVDHNTLQTGFENADDHLFLQTFCKRYGLYYSRPGNGICHQVHLERFGRPGKTLLGSDSHTPTGGGLGMLAIGAGGLDVAVAMGTGIYRLTMPGVIRIELKGALPDGCSAKDIILEVLRILTVKGGVGYAVEYVGKGAEGLSVYERATICNMGAELGATCSVFPSDAQALRFLESQGRAEQYVPLAADPDADYEKTIEIDLSRLEPLVAAPHSPDKVLPVREVRHIKVDQVCIGSCTNSTYADMMRVAHALKGRKVHENVSLSISPGSRQVLKTLAENGALADMIEAGARILESACGPCIGVGQAPRSAGVSLRTFNRNFEKRSGTSDAQVYLSSVETAVATAITGRITPLGEICPSPQVNLPERFSVSDSMLIPPGQGGALEAEVFRGINIKPFPMFDDMPDSLLGRVLIVTGDDVTTDHIMPGGVDVMRFRSNIPHLSRYCLVRCDPGFPEAAEKYGGGFIVGGYNYGQGSSREHAALAPVYLGVRAVIAKSFSRIHKSNLINSGIYPFEFIDPSDYDALQKLDELTIPDVKTFVKEGKVLQAQVNGGTIALCCNVSRGEADILLSGGMVRYIRDGLHA